MALHSHPTTLRTLTLAAAIALTGAVAWAADPADHSAHHPAPQTAPAETAAAPEPAQVNEQMQAMRKMHEKMALTRTPEERAALMAEHMKTLHKGMDMMNRMGGAGMGGMKKGQAAMDCDMHASHRVMEMRMEMMQSMMQMMMDRLPQPPGQ